MRLFPDDAACAAYVERIRWHEGFICQYCKWHGEPSRFSNRAPVVLRSRHCKRDTSLTASTVMQRTHTPISIWFWAAYLVSSQTPGMSTVQFQRQLGLKRYETAFQILHKLELKLTPFHGHLMVQIQGVLTSVRQLAQAIGPPVRSEFSDKTQEPKMLESAQACNGAVPVSWRCRLMHEIPQRLLGGAASLDLDDARFDFVWVFGRRHDSWIHKQVPQLLLPGDSEVPPEGRPDMAASLR